MKSITVHNIDDTLSDLIQAEARRNGHSLNMTIKNILHRSLTAKATGTSNKIDLSEFIGTWTKDDYQEFIQNTKDQERIDWEEWK